MNPLHFGATHLTYLAQFLNLIANHSIQINSPIVDFSKNQCNSLLKAKNEKHFR